MEENKINFDKATLFFDGKDIGEIKEFKLDTDLYADGEIKTPGLFECEGSIELTQSNGFSKLIKKFLYEYYLACRLSKIYNATRKPRIKKKLIKRLAKLDINYEVKHG